MFLWEKVLHSAQLNYKGKEVASSPAGIHLVSPDLVTAVQEPHASPHGDIHLFSETRSAPRRESQEPTFMGSSSVGSGIVSISYHHVPFLTEQEDDCILNIFLDF